MKNNSSRDEDYNLWVLLHQAKDAVFKAREKELSQYGITTMEAGCCPALRRSIEAKSKASYCCGVLGWGFSIAN